MPGKGTECEDGPNFLFYAQRDSDINRVSIPIIEKPPTSLLFLQNMRMSKGNINLKYNANIYFNGDVEGIRKCMECCSQQF